MARKRWQDTLNEIVALKNNAPLPKFFPALEDRSTVGLVPGELLILEGLRPASGRISPMAFMDFHTPILLHREMTDHTDHEIVVSKNRSRSEFWNLTQDAALNGILADIFHEPQWTDLEAQAMAQRVSRWRRG